MRFVDVRKEYVGRRDAVIHTSLACVDAYMTGNVIGRMLIFDIEEQEVSDTKRIRVGLHADSCLIENSTWESNALLCENVTDERRTVEPDGRSSVSILDADVSLRVRYEESGVHQSRMEVNLLSFSVDSLS